MIFHCAILNRLPKSKNLTILVTTEVRSKKMNKIEELEKQMAEIAKAIEAEKNKGREEALETVRKLIKQYSISQREVKSVLLTRKPRTAKSTAVKRVATKTASGKRRGRPPSKK